MSGGSHSYLYLETEDWHLDAALGSLLYDIFKAVEWAESSDTRREDAEKYIYDRILDYMNRERGLISEVEE